MTATFKVRCSNCGVALKGTYHGKMPAKPCATCGASAWEKVSPPTPSPGRVSASELGLKAPTLGRRAPGSFGGGKRS
jgi:hypothetical protein